MNELMLIVSIIGVIVATVSAVIAVASYRKATRVLRPVPSVILWHVEDSYLLAPVNLGGATAHDFRIEVKYPEGSRITELKTGLFTVSKGGIGHDHVILAKGVVPPGPLLHAILIKAVKDGKEVAPQSISAWCIEEKGIVTLPPP